jgi:sarcosine oxidase subunit alpha
MTSSHRLRGERIESLPAFDKNTGKECQSGRPTGVAAQSHRLATGGLIDRSAPLSFTFDGKLMTGFAGDTLASALVANGVKLVGRSFKYHRPRGILTAGSEEPNALVELRTGARREANTRATTAELYDGLEATSQNRWPSLRHDLMIIMTRPGRIATCW